MPAVVRVKRHIDEEPLGAFVLNAKRCRLDNENADAGAGIEDGEEVFGAALDTKKKDKISTVLKLAGTINNQDDAATTKFVRLTKEEAISRLTKEEAEELVKFRRSHPRTSDLLHRKREEKRQMSQENRFRVVNCLRKPLLEKANEGEECSDELEVSMGPKLTIVDIEKQPVGQAAEDEPSTSFATSGASSSSLYAESVNRASHVNTNASLFRGGNTQPSDSDTGYVYDLYLAEDQEEEEDDYADIDDNRLSAHPYYEETLRIHNGEESDFDEDDSNDENYYTNDYPDSDSEPSTDYKIRKALERFNLAYSEEFYTDDSSEDELAGYVYGGPNESNDSDDADYYQVLGPSHSPDEDEFIHTLDADECKDKDIDVVVTTDQELNDENDND
ncbi:probable RNA polymerase II nuclear localization protein SLC7A6OS [Teleopsis dalmanni]|uniref:probable RNA polymerase II nuclear localization protein SLC7A6OS n=1 Tax=Teleopsis dalmanni TaxID=139649 RepID=UPI0018CF7127|nr:probable RNA polymerase II nuclear localization protein SLC7A6OS [Teleopsis dalmanni]